MKNILAKFDKVVNNTLDFKSRILMVVFSLGLLMTFFVPIWHINLQAPQYPEGLDIYVYTYKIQGGNNGNDIEEVNTLNHYIGMKTLKKEELKDLNWIPFIVGFLIILGLRVFFISGIKYLLDVFVVALYFSLFSFFRFVYRLHYFGHNLDPEAPVKIDPFMPVVLGKKELANFITYSYPSWGSLFLCAFVFGSGILLFLNIRKQLRQ